MIKYSAYLVLLLLAGISGYLANSLFDNTYLVIKVDNVSITSAPTPEGFAVSPLAALTNVTNGSPQKFSWSIYADSQNYYLIKNVPLLLATSSYARMYGIRVNGKTGKSDQCMEN